jgi:FkbM family methyltransferase
MKTLVYVGANAGYGLYNTLMNSSIRFDKIYAFEPDPEIYKILKENFKNFLNINTINAGCSDQSGTKTLYVTENRVSSSLADVNMNNQNEVGGHSGGKPAFKQVDVNIINLYDFCEQNNIKEIDLLVTDCQGSDYTILKTMEPLLKERKIKNLFCETHRDGFEIYNGLDNSFSKFKELLNENYEIDFFMADINYVDKNNTEELFKHIEWDTMWKLKS